MSFTYHFFVPSISSFSIFSIQFSAHVCAKSTKSTNCTRINKPAAGSAIQPGQRVVRKVSCVRGCLCVWCGCVRGLYGVCESERTVILKEVVRDEEGAHGSAH